MCGFLRKVALSAFAFVAMMVAGFARGAAGDPGPIKAHSQTSITVKRGDQVNLEVRLTSETQVKISWASGGLVLSEKPNCQLATERHSVGRYPLVLTITHGADVFVIPYEITIEPMPIGGRPRSVIVPLEDPGRDLVHLSPSTFVARPLKGRGFREVGSDMEAMSTDWRPLSWSERLKTHPDASVSFGLPNHEQHVLGQKTDVWLSQVNVDTSLSSESGGAESTEKSLRADGIQERLVILTEGTLRSRQLDHTQPQWTILLPRMQNPLGQDMGSLSIAAGEQIFQTWLQVKADHKGDILIVRKRPKPTERSRRPLSGAAADEKVHIFVIRGSAQVTRTLCEGDFEACLAKNTTETLYMPAGTALALETDQDEAWGKGDLPWLSTADSQIFRQGFAETSPQYGPGEDPARYGPSWTLRRQGGPRTKELALISAQKALMEEEWLVALEEIYPFLGSLGDQASLVLGRAYTGLGIPAYAKKYLNMAQDFQRENPEPHLLLAHLSLRDMRWKEAAKHLATYDQLDGADSPWISYYHGVVADRLGDRRFARREMLSTIRHAQKEPSSEAAQLFVDAIERDSGFTASMMAGVFYDSRVLRSKVDQDLISGPDALRVDKVGGAQFNMAFQLRGYEDPEAELKLEGLLDSKIYFDGRLRSLNPIHPEIALRFAFQPGGNQSEEPWFRADMRPFIGTRVLGQVRALDDYGVDFELKSPRLRHVSLGVRSLMSKDPDPNYDDLLEPSLRELVPKDDQSHHDVRYWASLRLFQNRITKVAGKVTQSDYRYDGKTRRLESFTSQEVGLWGEHAMLPYHQLRWDLSFLLRSFSMSDDHRRDRDVNLSLRWSISQTPLLSHIFGLGYEQQASTRSTRDFSREMAEYQMRFDF